MGSEDAALFDAFAKRVEKFREFRRELVRRGVEIGPEAGREWGDNDANRSVRKALNDDLTRLAQVYAERSRRISEAIDRGMARTAWLVAVTGALAVLLALLGAVIIGRKIARPPRAHYASHRSGCGRQNRRQHSLYGTARRGRGARAVNRLLSADDARERGSQSHRDQGCGGARPQAGSCGDRDQSVTEIDRQVSQANSIATQAVSGAEWTNTMVKELNEAAGRIGDVVRLITDIAEQTNLLALNATIEAARAGEAGRGFAVVASEVKALAGQTAKATEDIGAQIAGMQHATMRSIEAIGAIERTIRQIGEISGAIAAAVTEQGAGTQEIARSVETAAKRTVDTADEVVRVGEATSATRDSATEVKAVADDLGNVAARIRCQVDQFCQKLHAA